MVGTDTGEISKLLLVNAEHGTRGAHLA